MTVTPVEGADKPPTTQVPAPGRSKRLLGVEKVERERWGKFKIRDADAMSANLLIILGAALLVVGLVHLGVLWAPVRLGRPSWEFGTLSQTFTNVPLMITGLILLTYGKVRHPRTHPRWPRRAAVGFIILAVVQLSMGGLYVMALPEVFRQAPPLSIGPLIRTVVRNGAEIVVYPGICLIVALFLWRGVARRE
jgi:hypothetical protein